MIQELEEGRLRYINTDEINEFLKNKEEGKIFFEKLKEIDKLDDFRINTELPSCFSYFSCMLDYLQNTKSLKTLKITIKINKNNKKEEEEEEKGEWEKFIESINLNSSIQTLHLGSSFGYTESKNKKNIEIVTNILKKTQMKSLKELFLFDFDDIDIHFSNEISQFLSKNQNIHSLKIYYFKNSKFEFSPICEEFKKNKNLDSLILFGEGIGKFLKNYISDILNTNKNIKHLILSDLKLDKQQLSSLLNSLNNYNGILSLDLSNNNLETLENDEMNVMLSSNTSLQNL